MISWCDIHDIFRINICNILKRVLSIQSIKYMIMVNILVSQLNHMHQSNMACNALLRLLINGI